MFEVIYHYIDRDTWIDGNFTELEAAIEHARAGAAEANFDIVSYITVTQRGYHLWVTKPKR